MKIEPCSAKNIAYVVQLGKELHDLGSLANVPFNWDYAFNSTMNAVESDDYFVWAGIDDAGNYAGFMGGHIMPFFFSPILMGVEDAWFVRPGAQGRTRLAIALMKRFMTWALDEKGAVMLQSGDIASIDPTAVYGIYRHLGFRRYGMIYKYAREQ